MSAIVYSLEVSRKYDINLEQINDAVVFFYCCVLCVLLSFVCRKVSLIVRV